MSEAERLGRAVLELTTDDGKLNAGIERAHRKSEGLGAQFERVGKIAAVAFAGMAAATAVLIKRQIDAADAIHKMGQSSGLGTQKLSEYAHAANLSGLSTEGLARNIGMLSRNMLDTAAGTGEAHRAFAALGISVNDAAGSLKGADQIMGEVADRFAGMEDGAGKTALSMLIFGRGGRDMIPMLNQGSAAINEMREEAKRLGVTFDAETGAAAERFNDNLTRLNAVKLGIVNTMTKELLPSLDAFSAAMVRAAKATDFFSGPANAVRILLETLVIVGSDLAFVFRMVGGEIGAIAAQVAALGRGDFKGFTLISEEWTRDAAQARTDLDEFQARIMGLRAAIGGPGDGVLGGGGEKKPAPALANEQALAQLAAREQEVRDAIRMATTESDRLALEQVAFVNAERARMEQEALQARLAWIDWEQAEAIRRGQEELDIAAERQRQLAAIERRGIQSRMDWEMATNQQRTHNIVSELANITAGVAQHNKTLFKINKAAGIANAILNAYIGISRTLREYPYPWNLIMAAAHAVVAFAQVAAIRRQEFGAGGAAPSLAGSTAATPVTPVTSGAPQPAEREPAPQAAEREPRGPRVVQVFVQGALSRSVLEEFATGLNRLRADGFPIFEVKAA